MNNIDEIIEKYYTQKNKLTTDELIFFEEKYNTDESFRQKAEAQKLLVIAIRTHYAKNFFGQQAQKQKQQQLKINILRVAAAIILVSGIGYFLLPEKKIAERKPSNLPTPLDTNSSVVQNQPKADISISSEELLTFVVKESLSIGYSPSSNQRIKINYIKSKQLKLTKTSVDSYRLTAPIKPSSVLKYENKYYLKIQKEYYELDDTLIQKITDAILIEELDKIDFQTS